MIRCKLLLLNAHPSYLIHTHNMCVSSPNHIVSNPTNVPLFAGALIILFSAEQPSELSAAILGWKRLLSPNICEGGNGNPTLVRRRIFRCERSISEHPCKKMADFRFTCVLWCTFTTIDLLKDRKLPSTAVRPLCFLLAWAFRVFFVNYRF